MRQAFIVEEPRHAALRALNYEPSVERLRHPRRGRTSTRLRDLVSDLGSGYATVFARIDCDRAHGVELLSQSDMFAAEPEGRVIRLDSMQRPERHLVKKWDVLLAGAGTLAPTELYGRALIADERLVGKYVGQDTLRLEFIDPEADESLFAYAFLVSPTGLRALRSASYGTKILRIRRDVLAELPIPNVDDRTRARVAELVRIAVAMRGTYGRELLAARAVVLAMPDMEAALAMCAERKRQAVVWSGQLETLSAWNYASTGGAMALLSCAWETRVGDVVAQEGFYRGNRYNRVPCEAPHGVEMLSQRDAFLVRPLPRRIVRPQAPDSDLFVPPGCLLLAGAGTLGEGEIFGRVALVSKIFAGRACTELLFRMHASGGNAELLFAYLTTHVGRRLLRSTIFGSKLVYLHPERVRALPCPELDAACTRRVRDHVRAAFAAKDEAAAAEEAAVRVIEEEVMPAWLA